MHVLFSLPRARHVACGGRCLRSSERGRRRWPTAPYGRRAATATHEAHAANPHRPHVDVGQPYYRVGVGAQGRSMHLDGTTGPGELAAAAPPGARWLRRHVMDLTAVGPCGVAKMTPLPRPPIMLTSSRPARRPAASRHAHTLASEWRAARPRGCCCCRWVAGGAGASRCAKSRGRVGGSGGVGWGG